MSLIQALKEVSTLPKSKTNLTISSFSFYLLTKAYLLFCSPVKAKSLVGEMLNKRLITKQTPKDGIPVNHVMVAESVDILRETYLCILMDR